MRAVNESSQRHGAAPGPVCDNRAALSVTVVICSYSRERWHLLRAACASVQRQLEPDDELIVVIDHDQALLADARTHLNCPRVLANEGQPGLSGARNTGVRASHTDVVAFLDDDATPRPAWLDGLRSVFEDDRVAIVGTAVEPRWEGGRGPRWFPAEFGWVVGCGYRGLPIVRAKIRNPIGASMAIRRSAFAVAGDFVEGLGRVGMLPVGCEETEFCVRVSAKLPGAAVVYEPTSAVDHAVPQARQRLSYFLRRCFYEGRSKRKVSRLAGSAAALSSERRYVRAVLPRAFLRGLGDGLLHGDMYGIARALVVALGLAATCTGYVLEAVAGKCPEPR